MPFWFLLFASVHDLELVPLDSTFPPIVVASGFKVFCDSFMACFPFSAPSKTSFSSQLVAIC